MYIELKKANKEIEKVVEFIKSNEGLFGYMNLKMYDAFYYTFEAVKDFPLLEDNIIELFYNWCEMQYDIAKEFLMDEYKIDFDKIRKYIGHTSSFYLVDGSFDMDDMLYTINDLLAEYCNFNFTEVYFDEDKIKLRPFDNYDFADVECAEEVEEIADGFYEWFIKYIEDARTVYNYIQGCKENQVEYFKDYLQNINDEEEYFINQEKEKFLQDKKTCEEIITKYNISIEDFAKLKCTIYTM